MASEPQGRIGVVDDEESIRDTVGFALRREGYSVETFGDGLSAWQQFERTLPDLAVIDILMPQIDGLELCRRLRAVSQAFIISNAVSMSSQTFMSRQIGIPHCPRSFMILLARSAILREIWPRPWARNARPRSATTFGASCLSVPAAPLRGLANVSRPSEARLAL